MRALRALPVAGADEDFAVLFTLTTMKFVDRHDVILIRVETRLNWVFGTVRAAIPRNPHRNRPLS